MFNTNIIIGIIAAGLALIGGIICSIAHSRSNKKALHVGGGILYGLSTLTTLYLGCIFIMNAVLGIAAYPILSMADGWIGSSIVGISWTVILQSIIALTIAVIGLLGSLLMLWFIRRRSGKKLNNRESLRDIVGAIFDGLILFYKDCEK